MSAQTSTAENKINFLDLIEIFWNAKLKIVAIVLAFAAVGYIYSIIKPVSYIVTTPLVSGSDSVFIDYTTTNDVLKENDLLNDQNLTGYRIDAPTVFKIFITEFNDYEEMIDVLKNDKFVKQLMKEVPDQDKRQVLLNYARSFSIKPPVMKDKNWTLSFNWHSASDGVVLFENAIKLTLNSVKETLFNDIDQLAISIDMKAQRSLELLHNQLKIIELTEIQKRQKNIRFLNEQAAIARELGIEFNILDANVLANSQSSDISLTISSSEVPYYLRGYNAIEKEISLIKSRPDDVRLLMAPGYIELKEKILAIENLPSSSQLRNSFVTIENDNPGDWIRYDFGLADIASTNRQSLYIAFTTLIGLFFGSIFILISNVLRKNKTQ